MNDKELVRELIKISKTIQPIVNHEALKNYHIQAQQIDKLLHEMQQNQHMPLVQLYRTDSANLFLDLTKKINDLLDKLSKDERATEKQMRGTQNFFAANVTDYQSKAALKQNLELMFDILMNNKPMLCLAKRKI